jgi:carboxyl-terminal processing protease
MLSQPQKPSQIPIAPTRSTNRRWLGYALAFFLAAGTFVSGVQIGQSNALESDTQPASIFSIFSSGSALSDDGNQRPNLDEFWRVWDLLDDKFATASTTKMSVEARLEGAINGLVDSYGDPYTVYFPPSDAAAFDENISGNFSGVGMEVGLRDGFVTIIAPLPDTPAERAGVLAGDVIVKIDDVSTEGMRIDTAVSMIRGEKGTVVNLQIYREGKFDFIDIPITRDTISIPTVKTEQEGDTFIIALYSFNAVAETQVRDALQTFETSGAKNLILDLRGNPGGYLQSAVAIAGYFLPTGKVVVKEEFGDQTQNKTFRTRGRQVGVFTPQNLVVLVDNGSASASEILAGALRDHGVATVIGSQTFGKGSVQELVKLDKGSSLKVTVARWVTPNNVSISEGGLEPDIIITRTSEQRVAGEDTQKNAALRFLRGEKVASETFENQVVSATTSASETGE